MVHYLKILVIGKVELFFDQTMFRNAARAMLLGLVCTVLVQSSSVTKSLIVPLVGAGFLSLAQVFPYVLGANVGTTVTATLAALVTGEVVSVTVALAHLLFNVTGMLLIWPMRKIPIALSSIVANYTSRSKLIPFVYILLVFFAIPLALIYLVR